MVKVSHEELKLLIQCCEVVVLYLKASSHSSESESCVYSEVVMLVVGAVLSILPGMHSSSG